VREGRLALLVESVMLDGSCLTEQICWDGIRAGNVGVDELA
jgi:hypothetical protein